MAWETSSRRSELPPDWDRVRADRLRKDGYRCTWKLPSGKRCPRPATDVDHVGDKMDHGRLRSLCARHHAQRTQAQAQAAKQKPPKGRPAEAHPGILR